MKTRQWLCRGLCLLLALVMVLGYVPNVVYAANTIPAPTAGSTGVKWSNSYTTATTTVNNNSQGYFVLPEGSSTTAPAFKYGDYFDYEVIQVGKVSGYENSTIKYDGSGAGDKYTLSHFKSRSSSTSYVYIKLTPKQNMKVDITVDPASDAWAHYVYDWTLANGGNDTLRYDNLFTGEKQAVAGSPWTMNSKEMITGIKYASSSSAQNTTIDVYKDNGYLLFGVVGQPAKLKEITFTINKVTVPKDAYTVSAASEKEGLASVSVMTGTSSSACNTAHTNGTEVKAGNHVKFTSTLNSAYNTGKYTWKGWCDKNGNVISTANPYTYKVDQDLDLYASYSFDATLSIALLPNNHNAAADSIYIGYIYDQSGMIVANSSKVGAYKSYTGADDTKRTLYAENRKSHATFIGWYAGPQIEYYFLHETSDLYSAATGAAVAVPSGFSSKGRFLLDYSKKWKANAELISMEPVLEIEYGDYDGKTIIPYFYEAIASHSATLVKPAVGGKLLVGNGTANPAAISANTTVTTNQGDTVTSHANFKSGTYGVQEYRLVAQADAGYAFVGWYVVDSNGKPIKELPGDTDIWTNAGVLQNVTEMAKGAGVTAVFEEIGTVHKTFAYVSEGGSYTVNGTAVPAGGLDATTKTDSFTLLATPAAFYRFVKWVDAKGNEVSRDNPYALPAKNEAVTPVFESSGTNITLKAPTVGSYTLKVGSTTYTMEAGSTDQTVTIDKTASYTLSATAPSGYEFYRWTKNAAGDELANSATITGLLPEGAVINAVFAKVGSAMYQVNGTDYCYLDQAITAAGSSGTIRVTRSGTVYHSDGTTKTFTIPTGVTLLVPHIATVGIRGASDPFPYACVTNSSTVTGETMAAPGDDTTVLKLTVPSGTTINVYGLMSVGGTVSGRGIIMGGEPHSDVYLENGATINVGNGTSYNSGRLSVCGFLYGGGTVNVKKGGRMHVPFAVNDFKYGGYTVGVASKIADKGNITVSPEIDHPSGELGIMPFSRYSVLAVQCEQVVEYGGAVNAYLDLYAGGDHNYSEIVLIGRYNESYLNCFIRLHEGATATITYTGTNKVENIGRTRIVLDGNTEFGYVVIYLNAQGVVQANVDSSKVTFPIPYNYDVVVNSGNLTLTKDVMLLPGATVTVNSGASLTANANLTVYDGLHDYTSTGRDMSNTETGNADTGNKHAVLSGFQNECEAVKNFAQVGYTIGIYPSTAALQNADLSGSAQLIVNGTLNLNKAFGGTVQTNGNGRIVTASSGFAPQTTTQIGGVGYWYTHVTGKYEFSYVLVGATVRTLNAQIKNSVSGEMFTLQSGKTYNGASANAFDLGSYTYDLYYASNYNTNYHKTVTETVSLPQIGTWKVNCGGNHSWDGGMETTAPTCTADGVKTITCTACGETKTESIAANGHTEVIDAAVAPDCENTGLTEGKHCSVCNVVTVAQTNVAALGHTWAAADCDTPKTCSVCGETEGEALGHTPAEAVKEKEVPASCYAEGSYDEVIYCSVAECKHEISRETKTIEKTAHSWNEGVVTTDPTCATEGVKTFTCTVENCGATKTEPVDKLTEHSWNDGEVTTNPTCTDAGVKTFTCSCGDSYTEVIPATGKHTGGAATCSAQAVCDVCKQAYGELAPNNHVNTTTINAKDATCVGEGYTGDIFCNDCKNTIAYGETIPATGHSYGEPEWSWNGDDANGYTAAAATFTCACGDERTVTDSEIKVDTTDATETTEGKTVYTAVVAFNEETYTAAKEVKIPVLVHQHKLTHHAAVEATCAAPGNIEYWSCDCGKYFIDAEGKTEVTEADVVIAKTNEHTDADSDGKCDLCGETTEASKPEPQKLISTSSVDLGNSLSLRFIVDPDLNDDGTAELVGSDNYAVVSKLVNGEWTVVAEVPQDEWGPYNNNRFIVPYDKIAGKQMADQFRIVIYNAAGDPVSIEYQDSVRDYAMRGIKSLSKDPVKNGLQLTMFVDFLNYGAAAQVNFKWNTSDLANSLLTEEQKAYATASASAENKREGDGGTNVNVESRIELGFTFDKSVIKTEKYYAVVTYTNHNGAEYSKTIMSTEFEDYSNGTKWRIPVYELAMADGDQMITCTIYDAERNQVAQAKDSVNSYMARVLAASNATVNLKSLASSALKLTGSAYKYFHRNDK